MEQRQSKSVNFNDLFCAQEMVGNEMNWFGEHVELSVNTAMF
jgi:hypothetical protein